MNCIFLRRGYGTSGDGVNYVEYIESSGTQFIDTGFKPKNDSKITAVVSDYTNAETGTAVWGTHSSSSDRYDFFGTTGGGYRSYYGGTAVTFDSAVSYSEKVTVERNANAISIGDYSIISTPTSFACANPLYLFAHNSAGTANKFASFKLYSCQIYDRGTLIKDYRPCLDPDGVACLYDKVNKEYVYNAGSGTFTAGASIGGGVSDGGITNPDGPVSVNMSGSINSGSGTLEIFFYNLSKSYYSGDLPTSVAVEKGEISIVYIAGGSSDTMTIIHNGAVAYSGVKEVEYQFTINSNCTISASGNTCTITTS